MAAPAVFRSRIADHNRSCWIAAALCTLGAWLSWLLFFAFAASLVLVFETVRTGNVDLAKPPDWAIPAGIAAAVIMLAAAAFQRWIRRYRPPPDRPIIGWHLASEFLLLPARITYSIWDHLAARIVQSRNERDESWKLLLAIFEMGRAEESRLAYDFQDPDQLRRMLLNLQLAGWIDLHQSEDGWFYRVSSDEESVLRGLTRPPEEPDIAED